MGATPRLGSGPSSREGGRARTYTLNKTGYFVHPELSKLGGRNSIVFISDGNEIGRSRK